MEEKIKRPLSEETKRRISVANLGKKRNNAFRLRLSEVNKGKVLSEETKKKMSQARQREWDEKKRTPVLLVKYAKEHLKGSKFSVERRREMSEYQKSHPIPKPWKNKKLPNRSGVNHHNWKGGITPIHKKIRNSLEIKLWRESVFKRDDFTCQICGARGVYLQADHIKPFAFFPELRFELSNGRTLCKFCHRKTDTFASRAKKFK